MIYYGLAYVVCRADEYIMNIIGVYNTERLKLNCVMYPIARKFRDTIKRVIEQLRC